MQAPVSGTPFGPIQQAYVVSPGDDLIQGWCPLSKIQGPVDSRHQSAGIAWGTCPSKFINTRDVNLNCAFEQNLAGISIGHSSDVGARVSMQMVSPSSGAKLGPANMMTLPRNFGESGLLNNGAGVPLIGMNFESGSGVEGPRQNYSYGSYSGCQSCQSNGYSSFGVGTAASSYPADSPCGANSGTRYWKEVQGGQYPNRMANTLGYGGN